MRKLFFFLSLSLLIITCKKKDGGTGNGVTNPPPVIPPPVVKTTYTVDSASTEPGFFLTLTADKKIIRDTATVLLGTIPVILIKLDTLHYGFYVPAINAGTQILDLKNIDAANTPTAMIRSYTGITNPDAALTQLINEYNQLTDSLLINSINNSVTSADAQFMHQLMDQLTESIKSLSASEKMNLAYQFQNMTLDKSWGQKTVIDTAFFLFRMYGPADEIMDQVTQWSKNHNTNLGRALQLVTPLMGALLTFSITKNVYAAAAAFAIVATYFMYTKAIKKEATETSSTAAYVNDVVYEKDGNGTVTNPETVEDNQSRWEKLMSKFRTLQKSDNTGLNNDISNFINSSEKLETEDNSIKTKFESLKTSLSNFFGKITTAYPSYISPIFTTAKEKLAEAKAKFITISNISNPKISIVATDDGIKGLKLTFTNPDKSIITETPFTYQLTYNQNSINRKVSITQHAKYIVSSVQVSTAAPTGITYSSANIGGTVSVTGTVTITGRGICYGTTQNPTFEHDSKITAGSGTGSFTGNLISLDPGVKYFARAYAISNATVIYGNQVDFTTTSINLATIITNGATAITSTTATLGGYISNDGGAPVSQRGLCYGTDLNPTYENNLKTADGTGTGTFLSFLSNLLPAKTYHARAYAITSAGIAYGVDLTFTTEALFPSVTTASVTNITVSSANCGGTVISDGGVTVTARGICWSSTNTNPTIADAKTISGSGTGSFTGDLSSLTPYTAYYVRAFATNSSGTAYGASILFNTTSLESVAIGSQTWLKKNLNVTTYRNGDPIPEVRDQTQWANLTTGAWCHYENNPANDAIYGKLYNSYAVNDPRGLAPTGWHIPADVEWKSLSDY
ncbi:MAG: fibrobacter succinogenes major paralogous domain-containing protein, partial [Lacibacter sp.]